MKKNLFFICIVFCQVIITSQKDLKRSQAISLLNDDHVPVQDVVSNRVNDQTLCFHTSKSLGDNNTAIVSLWGNSSVEQHTYEDIDLGKLFNEDIDLFFKKTEKGSQASLQKFYLQIMKKEIKIKDNVRNAILRLIEQNFTIESILYVLSHVKNNEIAIDTSKVALKNDEFNIDQPKTYLFNKFYNYFLNKKDEMAKIKEVALSLNSFDVIKSDDDLLTILNEIFKNKYSILPEEFIEKTITSSVISIDSLNKEELTDFFKFFIEYNCFFGIEKIIESNNFKKLSDDDLIKNLVFILDHYKSINGELFKGHKLFMDQRISAKIKLSEKTEPFDLEYRKIILNIFNIKNDVDTMVKLFMQHDYKGNIVIDKKDAFVCIFILAKLDENYIPLLIKASKYLQDKSFLYHQINFKMHDLCKDNPTFLSNLVLKDFFNDSKEELTKLLETGIGEYNKPLVSAILHKALSSVSSDPEFIKEVKKEIDLQIKKLQLSNESDFEKIKKQKQFINELQAINSLKDDFSNLSSIDHMFYSAYLEYLKGNKRDLRNLVFPVGKNVYALAPQKGSETQAMSLIRNSLNKIFKEDRIEFLLFDLVKTKYQQQSGLELLVFMGLRSSKSQNSPAAQASA